MKYITLTQNTILQCISKKQFETLVEARVKVGNRANISVPLQNEARGIVVAFFAKDKEIGIAMPLLLAALKYHRCKSRTINTETVTRFRFYNYMDNTFNTQTDHPDYRHFDAEWSLQTALKCIDPSDYYLIAKHVE